MSTPDYPVFVPQSHKNRPPQKPYDVRPTGPLDLTDAVVDLQKTENHILLLKFTVDRLDQVPKGIPEQVRESDVELDRRHAVEASAMGRPELGKLGKERIDRVDTGRPVVRNLGLVQVQMLRRGITNAGGLLTKNHHYFIHPKSGKPTIVLEYTLPNHPDRLSATTATEIAPEAIEGIRELSRATWQYCHVWENPDGKVTVNMVTRQGPKAKPAYMLAIRKHHLVALPFEESED